MAEFIAIGTAVKHRDGVLHRAPNGRPFQSDLSGQEFWTLLRTGHRPVGMVMGSCVYHVGRRGRCGRSPRRGATSSCPNFTQALYDARELAMQRMQTEAQELGRRGDRRRLAVGEEPRLGQPRDRVLRARHRDRRRPRRRTPIEPRSPCSTSTTADGARGPARSPEATGSTPLIIKQPARPRRRDAVASGATRPRYRAGR